MRPSEFTAIVVEHIRCSAAIADTTMDQVLPAIAHFGTFLEVGLGVEVTSAVRPEHVQAFLGARKPGGPTATYASIRTRRMALRMAYRAGRELGIVGNDPTIDIDIGPSRSISARPLTTGEVELGRSFALTSVRDMRRSIAWALAEATALTSEMGVATIGDLDPVAGRVWLGGSPGTDPRWGYFSDWGKDQVHRRLRMSPESDESLIAWRKEPKTPRAAASQAVKETLKAAGLHGPGVRPRSIVAWAGRHLLKNGAPIDQVARRLGMRSLDQAADFIRMDWRGDGP